MPIMMIGRFEHARHDEAECQRLVDTLDDGEHRDGAADAGQRVDEVEEAGPQHLGVVARRRRCTRGCPGSVSAGASAGTDAAKVSR